MEVQTVIPWVACHLETLCWAVLREQRNNGKALGPEQRLSRMEALRAFTLGGAYFSFEEDRRGSLEPGNWLT